jgi:predicted anti-sigma-YlaC factor YlaD
VTERLDCTHVEARLSEYLDGALGEPARTGIEAHVGACDACGPLLEAMREVVAALRSVPVLEPSADLAARAAEAALRAAPLRRAAAPAQRLTPPAWLLAAAAAVALAASAGVVALSGDRGGAGRFRMLERTGNAAAYLAERKDRFVEDIRILRVVIGTAFEGRLERVNDRVDDYRRLLEKRRAAAPVEKTRGFLMNNDDRRRVSVCDGAGADDAPGAPA